MGGVLVMNVLRQHGRVAWVVPTYKNGRALWRWSRAVAAPLGRAFDISRADRTISTHRGGFFGIYSADNIDAIRGEWFHLVVIDEAARIDESDWTDAIQPTLADADGDAILISTPAGRNWFWHAWQRGQLQQDGFVSWQAPTSDNPNPRIRRAAQLARERVSQATYEQEWLAQFIADGAGVFRNVRAAVTAKSVSPSADPGGYYVAGLDWGKLNDATVLTIIDANTRSVVSLDRWVGIDYRHVTERIAAICQEYRPVQIVAERNAMGEPLIEHLSYEYSLPVVPFTTSLQSKADLIEALALAFERGTIAIPDQHWLIVELEAYERTRTTGLGLPSYSAPAGLHDDGVMSLALAWSGVRWVYGGQV